jgi:hypothetical protein
MKKRPGSGTTCPARADQSKIALRPAASPEPGTERWFGVSDARAESRRPDPFRVIGTAHGPRLLELLRAS